MQIHQVDYENQYFGEANLISAEMKYTKLVPNIFYDDIEVGKHLFIDCLKFKLGYEQNDGGDPFCIVERGNLKAMLIQSLEFAAKDRPELRLETDDIEAAFKEITEADPRIFHPNGKTITRKPWGALEFALLDASGVCVIVQQWSM